MGDRAHLAASYRSLDTYVADVSQTIVKEDLEDVILVAHSFAGQIVPNITLATEGRIRTQVFLDAYLPVSGRSIFSLSDQEQAWRSEWEAISFDGPIERMVPVPDAAELGIDDASLWEWVKERLVAIPLSAYTEPVRFAPEGLLDDMHFIECSRNPHSFKRHAERARAHGARHMVLDEGHMAMLTAPDLLASAFDAIGQERDRR